MKLTRRKVIVGGVAFIVLAALASNPSAPATRAPAAPPPPAESPTRTSAPGPTATARPTPTSHPPPPHPPPPPPRPPPNPNEAPGAGGQPGAVAHRHPGAPRAAVQLRPVIPRRVYPVAAARPRLRQHPLSPLSRPAAGPARLRPRRRRRRLRELTGQGGDRGYLAPTTLCR